MRGLIRLLALVLIVAAAALYGAQQVPLARAPLLPRYGPALTDVEAWGYQLQSVKPSLIPAEIDLLVTDFSRDGSASGAWSPEQVAALRRRGGGKPRIILAYLSIGEAESYRHYWRAHWRVAPPSWLGRENKDWKGNYAVRYWDPAWQKLLFDAAPRTALQELVARWLPGWFSEPYLDRIMAAGFDGVFLDKVDGFDDWSAERKSAADDMVRLVGAISDYVKARRPGFLVVPQNGEELLRKPGYVGKINGFVKEDLVFGISGDGKPNTVAEVTASTENLALAGAAGLPVFVVEYVDDPAARERLLKLATVRGYRILFARRALNLPPEIVSTPAPEPGTGLTGYEIQKLNQKLPPILPPRPEAR